MSLSTSGTVFGTHFGVVTSSEFSTEGPESGVLWFGVRRLKGFHAFGLGFRVWVLKLYPFWEVWGVSVKRRSLQ